jgi:hypothetical protein
LALLGLVVGVVATLSGCNSFPDSFQCSADSQCRRGGDRGVCTAGACAFDDPSCPATLLRYDRTAGGGNAGMCVSPGGLRDSGGPDDGLLNDCGGTATLPARVLDPCGNCLLGRYQCDGTNELRCEGEPTNEAIITDMGYVSASSTYSSEFMPPLAVDGDQTTSWFSAGPEAGGAPTTYEWTVRDDVCIVGVSFYGNGLNADPSYRNDFGFGSMTVQILDAADGIQASDTRTLDGTPDPEQHLDIQGYGRTVRLLFTGHESTDCGGFSELVVTAAQE